MKSLVQQKFKRGKQTKGNIALAKPKLPQCTELISTLKKETQYLRWQRSANDGVSGKNLQNQVFGLLRSKSNSFDSTSRPRCRNHLSTKTIKRPSCMSSIKMNPRSTHSQQQHAGGAEADQHTTRFLIFRKELNMAPVSARATVQHNGHQERTACRTTAQEVNSMLIPTST